MTPPEKAGGSLENGQLKRKSMNGAAFGFAAQIVKFCLTLVNQILLARLLMPQDFGLVAMVAPIIAFAQMLADLGLTQATIQRPQISQAQLSFLFWLNFAASAALALIVIGLSPLIGWFYGEPKVAAIAAVLGSTFLLNGLCTQQLAIFNRNLDFIKLACVDVAAFSIGMMSGLLAAANGFHYWSLVITQAGSYFSFLILSWSLSRWRPSGPCLPEDWRSLLGFGGNLTGFNIVNYFARNLDNILIGRFNGETALGLYDRAYKLLLLPLNQVSAPISRVALPLLARTQEEPDIYRKIYRRAVEMMLLFICPGVLVAVVAHDHLIRTVLGERWAPVGPIFAILGLGGLFQPLGQSTGWLFMSQGRTREMRNWGLGSSALLVASFIVGLPWGPIGVAAAYITVGLAQAPVLLWFVTRHGPVRMCDILDVVRPYAVAGLVCAVAVYALDACLPAGLIALIINALCAYAVFIGVLWILPSGRAIIKELRRPVWAMFTPLLARAKAPVAISWLGRR